MSDPLSVGYIADALRPVLDDPERFKRRCSALVLEMKRAGRTKKDAVRVLREANRLVRNGKLEGEL